MYADNYYITFSLEHFYLKSLFFKIYQMTFTFDHAIIIESQIKKEEKESTDFSATASQERSKP